MKKSLIFALFGLTLFTGLRLEAGVHFGMQFGGGYVERRVLEPVLIEEYYAEYPCCCHPRLIRRQVPVYRERVFVEPRPCFSFRFF